MNTLPTCLTDFVLFQELDESEQRGFESRLLHCREICIAATNISLTNVDQLLESIDSLELDVYSAMGATSTREGVSPYRVHTGWGVLLNSIELKSHFAREFYELMAAAATPSFDAEASLGWVHDWGRRLEECLNALSAAKEYSFAFSRLLEVDALMATFLTFAISFRINVANSPS